MRGRFVSVCAGIGLFMISGAVAWGIIVVAGTGAGNRYDFAVQHEAQEIYIFDRQTARIYLTSPEMIADYHGEMWTELCPLDTKKRVAFRDFLSDGKERRLREFFLRKKQQAESTPPARQ
ncbi:MAG: hypothetical protein NC924_04025 [Candidatus Omnitrophica bacterium]|nr:hypothetical protein [Candidatus Omnitrophota bacterium]